MIKAIIIFAIGFLFSIVCEIILKQYKNKNKDNKKFDLEELNSKIRSYNKKIELYYKIGLEFLGDEFFIIRIINDKYTFCFKCFSMEEFEKNLNLYNIGFNNGYVFVINQTLSSTNFNCEQSASLTIH